MKRFYVFCQRPGDLHLTCPEEFLAKDRLTASHMARTKYQKNHELVFVIPVTQKQFTLGSRTAYEKNFTEFPVAKEFADFLRSGEFEQSFDLNWTVFPRGPLPGRTLPPVTVTDLYSNLVRLEKKEGNIFKGKKPKGISPEFYSETLLLFPRFVIFKGEAINNFYQLNRAGATFEEMAEIIGLLWPEKFVLNKKPRTKFLEALTGGKYWQTRGTTKDTMGHCALGVLLDCLELATWNQNSDGSYSNTNPPKTLQGLQSIGLDDHSYGRLIYLNDVLKLSLVQIADYIEEHS